MMIDGPPVAIVGGGAAVRVQVGAAASTARWRIINYAIDDLTLDFSTTSAAVVAAATATEEDCAAALPQRPALAVWAAPGAATCALAARLPACASGDRTARRTIVTAKASIATSTTGIVCARGLTIRVWSGASAASGHDQPRGQASGLRPRFGAHV